MSAFSEKYRYFYYYGNGGNDPFLEEKLRTSLKELRDDFVDYRKRRRLDKFKGATPEISQSYNALMWAIKSRQKRKHKFVSMTCEKYFALRSELFAMYYEAKNKRKVDYSKRHFFDRLDEIDFQEVRHTLKKNEVVYTLKFKTPSKDEIINLVKFEMYTKSYVEFCLKFKCDNDPIIKKLDPNDYRTKRCWTCNLVFLIRTFQEAKSLIDAKEKMRKKFGRNVNVW